MLYLSVTRLKLKSFRYLLSFLFYTDQILREIRASEGYLQGKLMATHNLSMWTMTLWTSEESARNFYLSGSHQLAMEKISEWTSEAVHINHPTNWDQLPPWTDVTQLLANQGHFVPLTNPSENHLKRFITQPSLKFILKI
ncbi:MULTISPECIES: hypothetical protein [Pseudanabaena]|uniref:DUF3291 domain-containing protein n=2 Tax=Pseudanabaena TaxID=1152 RepID=L8N5C0_9CYAN|nr:MULTISPECIES: hypothetical protein [Pseudanabaena]ELS33890.1 hypothetical protein Pse7429DRAFT_1114 [Pseudanabaena biceps PCC 7429]MDG3493916.1 hypothetical protein [Pseudanabaena catenata USMAC16]